MVVHSLNHTRHEERNQLTTPCLSCLWSQHGGGGALMMAMTLSQKGVLSNGNDHTVCVCLCRVSQHGGSQPTRW